VGEREKGRLDAMTRDNWARKGGGRKVGGQGRHRATREAQQHIHNADFNLVKRDAWLECDQEKWVN